MLPIMMLPVLLPSLSPQAASRRSRATRRSSWSPSSSSSSSRVELSSSSHRSSFRTLARAACLRGRSASCDAEASPAPIKDFIHGRDASLAAAAYMLLCSCGYFTSKSRSCS
jgi:hypothetical protein